MTLKKKLAATLKVRKKHTRKVCIRLVKGLCEPYQSLLSASMSNGTVTLLERIAKGPDRQVTEMGKFSAMIALRTAYVITGLLHVHTGLLHCIVCTCTHSK